MPVSPLHLNSHRSAHQDGLAVRILSNAVLVWNTIQIQKVVEELRASGQPVKDEDLARVSPLLRANVIPNGSYDLSARLDQVQKFLRHRRITTTQIYAETSLHGMSENYLRALGGKR